MEPNMLTAIAAIAFISILLGCLIAYPIRTMAAVIIFVTIIHHIDV